MTSRAFVPPCNLRETGRCAEGAGSGLTHQVGSSRTRHPHPAGRNPSHPLSRIVVDRRGARGHLPVLLGSPLARDVPGHADRPRDSWAQTPWGPPPYPASKRLESAAGRAGDRRRRWPVPFQPPANPSRRIHRQRPPGVAGANGSTHHQGSQTRGAPRPGAVDVGSEARRTTFAPWLWVEALRAETQAASGGLDPVSVGIGSSADTPAVARSGSGELSEASPSGPMGPTGWSRRTSSTSGRTSANSTP